MKVKDIFGKDGIKFYAFERFHDFLHHMAEEELVACHIHHLKLEKVKEGGGVVIGFYADCKDKPRDGGYQKDLSEKLNERIMKHKLPGLQPITARIYHEDLDPR